MRVLNRVSCNEVNVAPGQVVYTQWLNARGGIESDLTVFRLVPTSTWSSPQPRASCATGDTWSVT